VVLLQLTMLFGAPFSACCVPAETRTDKASTRSAEVKECCPPGSHPPGQCPLHRGARKGAQASSTECRIRCGTPHTAGLIAGGVGVLPAPAISTAATISFDLDAVSAPRVTARPAHPDAPPPKLL